MAAPDSLKNPAAVTLGKLGGESTSERKITASRENGKKGGRPKMETNAAAEDFGTFISIRLKDDDNGTSESPYLRSASDVIAWIESHPAVTTWRVTGTMAARLGSIWRQDGTTMMRYFANPYTAAQFREHLMLAGQAEVTR